MKKWITVFFMFIIVPFNYAFSQIPLPQLKSGIPLNDSITTLNYCFPGNCNPLGDVIFKLDSLMIPLVQGVHFNYRVIQLTTAPGSVSTLEKGITNIGDTFFFSPGGWNQYSFYASSAGCMQLSLFITGTPTVPNIAYPCQLQTFCTLANCGNTCLSIPENPFQCMVSDQSGDSELDVGKQFNVLYRQPGNLLFVIPQQQNNRKVHFALFDYSGKLMMNKKFSSAINSEPIDVTKLTSGIYFWQLMIDGKFLNAGKVNHIQEF